MCSYAWIPGSIDVEYEGRVYQTEKDSVLLLFYPGFHETFSSGTKFNVRFTLNRIAMRLIDVADSFPIDLTFQER